jgi:GH18 family chitinase
MAGLLLLAPLLGSAACGDASSNGRPWTGDGGSGPDAAASGSSSSGGGSASSGSSSGGGSSSGSAVDSGPAHPGADGGAGEGGPPARTTKLVGYLPDYNGSYAGYATSVDFSKMTHINFAFLNPPSCGGTCTSGSDMTFGLGQSDADIATFVKAAHAAGVKVVASIGGGGGDQMIIQFYNPGLSTQLVASLDTWITAHDLDGVDLDIEDPGNMGQPYADFVSALVNEFRPKGKLVTAAVAQYLQGSMPDSALHQFDYVNDMFYSADVNGAKSELDFYVQQKGVPASQVVLGVPFFGQQGNSEPEYSQILQMYPNAWQTDSTNGITYVGEATMANETQLGKQYGGIMVWELTGDAPAPHSLLAVINNNL